ncbi:disulfide bond formation protein B [Patescibacteria group bacterium]|nr:disulfide bond formation protein B [Patescibacteria group bacterium]
MNSIDYLNIFLGSGAILLQILSVIALGLLFFRPRENRKNFYLDFIDKHFLILVFLISLAASIFPLVYSEIIHFIPCYLCWWQRVFMFPLPLMFGVALWYKDRKVIRYALPLLCVGFLISIYQNFFYYFGGDSNLPCDASGVSCYQHLVSVFGGYISIPMLALTAFFTLLTLLAVAHFYKKEN